MRNNTDKVIKDKMGSLDPLGGGIVFGKEEAWEKLQTRLDRPPARRFLLKYSPVAACLLLMVATACFHFYNTREIAVNDKQRHMQNKPDEHLAIWSENKINATVDTSVIHAPQTKNNKITQINNSPLLIVSKHDTVTRINQPSDIMGQDTTHDKHLLVNKDAPALKVRTPMKVVSINDLESSYGPVEVAHTNIGTHPATMATIKMSVVHFNDLMEYNQQRRIDEFVLTHEDSFVANSFKATDKKNYLFHTPFKIKGITQN